VKASRLERAIGTVLRVGTFASSICLGLGLVLSFFDAVHVSELLLQVGIVMLLATPVARVAVSIVEYINEGDWTFVMLTGIVLVELMASVVAALVFKRKA
jgi:uncharacterized membrane protein